MHEYFQKHNIDFDILTYLEGLLDCGLAETVTQISNELYDVRFGFIEHNAEYNITQNIPKFISFNKILKCNYIIVYGGLVVRRDGIIKKGMIYHVYDKKNGVMPNIMPQLITLSDNLHITDIIEPNEKGTPSYFLTPIFLDIDVISAKTYVEFVKRTMDIDTFNEVYDDIMCCLTEYNAENYIDINEIQSVLKNTKIKNVLDNKLKSATIIGNAIKNAGSVIAESNESISKSIDSLTETNRDAMHMTSDGLKNISASIAKGYRFK